MRVECKCNVRDSAMEIAGETVLAIPLRWGCGWREQKKIPDGSQGYLTYAATGAAGAGAGGGSGCGAAGRGLVTPAMKRSASLIALSMERQG
jgi:hypothetical protein